MLLRRTMLALLLVSPLSCTQAESQPPPSDGGADFQCPTVPPADGTSCQAPSMPDDLAAHCSWGDDPRLACRTRATCDQGSWKITKLDQACDAPALPAECPSPSPTWGDSCDASLACMYPSAMRCVCSSKCDAGAVVEDGGLVCPYVWSCYAASSACPNPTPQAGSPCSASDEGIDCGDAQYHVCGILVRCVDGLWQWTEATNCPVLL